MGSLAGRLPKRAALPSAVMCRHLLREWPPATAAHGRSGGGRGAGDGRGGGGRAWGADGHTIGATCCHILPWQQNGSTACSWLFKDGRPCVHVPVIKSSIHRQHTVGLYINVPLGRRRLVSECQSINVRACACVWPVYTITRLDCWLVWTTWLQVTQIL